MPKNDNNEAYDVIFFWDNTREPTAYKQYCGETLCNIMGFPAALSVKLVFEAHERGRTLLYTTKNLDQAVELRDTLTSLELSAQICPVSLTNMHHK